MTFLSEDFLALSMKYTDSIKASLSGTLHRVEDRVGYIFRRIPRTIENPVSNLVSPTLVDIKNIARTQTSFAPSSTHWLQHENRHDSFHTTVGFFPKEALTFRIVGSCCIVNIAVPSNLSLQSGRDTTHLC